MKYYLCFILLVLSACSSMEDIQARQGIIEKSTDDYSQMRTVRVTPTGVFTDTAENLSLSKLGAVWQEANTDNVLLEFSYDADILSQNPYLSYQKAHIKIDGVESSFSFINPEGLQQSPYNHAVNQFHTNSMGYIEVPKSYLDRMISAKDVRLLIEHNTTTEIMLFHLESDQQKPPLAKSAIKSMLAEL